MFLLAKLIDESLKVFRVHRFHMAEGDLGQGWQGNARPGATSAVFIIRLCRNESERRKNFGGERELLQRWHKCEEAINFNPDDLTRKCLAGIHTILIDDGLDSSNIHSYRWR